MCSTDEIEALDDDTLRHLYDCVIKEMAIRFYDWKDVEE